MCNKPEEFEKQRRTELDYLKLWLPIIFFLTSIGSSLTFVGLNKLDLIDKATAWLYFILGIILLFIACILTWKPLLKAYLNR